MGVHLSSNRQAGEVVLPLTLIFVQKFGKHVRRGPPRLQIRPPNTVSKDGIQDDAKEQEAALGDAHQEEDMQRTVIRYRECGKWI